MCFGDFCISRIEVSQFLIYRFIYIFHISLTLPIFMEMQLAHRVAQKSGRMKHLAMCKFSVKILFKKKYMLRNICFIYVTKQNEHFLEINRKVKLTAEFMRPLKKFIKLKTFYYLYYFFLIYCIRRMYVLFLIFKHVNI